MKKYQLHIRLLSDLCVSDGGVYNSSLDIDICHDEYGFPYIPGRRIKGCLRECAVELSDWGKDINIEKIFGSSGDMSGALSIRNAYIKDYYELRKQVEKYQNSLLFHPQNILSHYSYIRTQTAVNKGTGTAKDKSLRVMRVAKKGLLFIADVEIDEVYKTEFEEILSVFHYMGISRTRGLGEIKAECLPVKDNTNNLNDSTSGMPESLKNVEKDSRNDDKKYNLADEISLDMDSVNRQIEKDGCLRYSVYLEEPLICKSIDGGESKSLDYIQGSRILGIVLQEIKAAGESLDDFFSDAQKLFFSNAYLEEKTYPKEKAYPEEKGERLVEVPASYYSIKDNDEKYFNLAYENKENKERTDKCKWQMNAMKHYYVGEAPDGSLIRKSVAMEERYHHRRPDDKSIGHVIKNENDSGIFYQVSSIAAGQSFQGYIRGTKKQLQIAAQCLSMRKYYSIGTSRSSEYGKVTIKLHFGDKETDNKRVGVDMPSDKGMELMIKLESPAIIYSKENVTCSTDVKDLVEEVNVALGLTESGHFPYKIDDFVNYTSVGGYNVTWNRRKPTVQAFDKGTVLVYHFESRPFLSVDLKNNRQVIEVIGERNLEGYGEISISELLPENDRFEGKIYSPSVSGGTDEKINVKEIGLADKISRELWKEYIRVQAQVKTKSFCEDKFKKVKAAVNNMLGMCEEQKTWEGFKASVEQRFDKNNKKKRDKGEFADDIIEIVEEEMCKLPERFFTIYNICGWETDEEEAKITYMKAYLTELKYRIREYENKKGGSNYEP